MTFMKFIEMMEELHRDVQFIKTHIREPSEKDPNELVSNEQFIRDMGISKRTAQRWRDKGKLKFVQMGRKIYYRQSDIDAFVSLHQQEAFSNAT